MARAFQCDRCGKFYQFKSIKRNDDIELYGVNLTTDAVPIVVWGGRIDSRELNLCVDCIQKFVQFMKNEEEKKNGTGI